MVRATRAMAMVTRVAGDDESEGVEEGDEDEEGAGDGDVGGGWWVAGDKEADGDGGRSNGDGGRSDGNGHRC